MFANRAIRSMAFWSIAALAFTTQVTVSAVTIRLTTTALSRSSVYATALAASVVDVCVLAVLLAAIGTRRLSQGRSLLTTLSVLSATVALLAAVLSIYTLAWSLQHKEVRNTGSLAVAGIAMAVVALFSEASFFAYLLWPQKPYEDSPELEIYVERPSPVRSVKRSLSVHLSLLTPTLPRYNRSKTEPYSLAGSAYATSPNSSVRHSFSQALRSKGSKTRLIRQSFMSSKSPSVYSGRPISFDTVRQDDGFETWVTSAAEESTESPCAKKTTRKLEPIPGSRPVSPARPLDGPFPELAPEDTPLPDTPIQSPLTSPISDTDSLDDLEMPPLREPSMDQSHIHPLFRAESPLPPPMPSPRTVITASPFAGQIVGPEHALTSKLLGSTQNSRPGSATPVSPAVSRPGSVKGFRSPPVSSMEMPPALPYLEHAKGPQDSAQT